MVDWLLVVFVILVCGCNLMSYLLGKQHGQEDMKTKVRYILQDSAKIAQETLWGTRKP